MKQSFVHRCRSCWHAWFTVNADSRALCPKCKSGSQITYRLEPHHRSFEHSTPSWLGSLIRLALSLLAMAALVRFLFS